MTIITVLILALAALYTSARINIGETSCWFGSSVSKKQLTRRIWIVCQQTVKSERRVRLLFVIV